MPRKPKRDKGEILEDETAATASNGGELTGEQRLEFLEAVEAEEDAMADILAKAAKLCQPHHDEIKAIKKAAAEKGFTKKVFGAHLKQRKHQFKADHVTDALNEKQKAEYEDVRLSLETLAERLPGLGEAARDRHAAGAESRAH